MPAICYFCSLMRRHIPNLFTLSNLFLGCCALLFVLDGQVQAAAWCTLGSFICDYLDGMLARALGVSSPLGKELDSLADVVSFGVVPGAMLYHLLSQSAYCSAGQSPCLAALPAFVLSMFAAYRLGKFNLDTRQTTYFLGLSTPACTIFVMGITLGSETFVWLKTPWLIYALIPLLSALMVGEIPMYGLKIKKFDLSNLSLPLGFMTLFFLLWAWFGPVALSAIIVLYILSSLISPQRVKA